MGKSICCEVAQVGHSLGSITEGAKHGSVDLPSAPVLEEAFLDRAGFSVLSAVEPVVQAPGCSDVPWIYLGLALVGCLFRVWSFVVLQITDRLVVEKRRSMERAAGGLPCWPGWILGAWT